MLRDGGSLHFRDSVLEGNVGLHEYALSCGLRFHFESKTQEVAQ